MSSYIVPFIRFEDTIQLLLGHKKCFSKHDGFIHNNPGQTVFVGGGCKSALKEKRIRGAFREFREETGHVLNNVECIHTIVHNKKYTIIFYEVNDMKVYGEISTLSDERDLESKELDYVMWVDIEEAKNLFFNEENNRVFHNKRNSNIIRYMESLKEYKNIEKMKEFKHLKRTEDEKKIILNDITYNTISSKYFDEVFHALVKHINSKAYIDWFSNGLEVFIKNI